MDFHPWLLAADALETFDQMSRAPFSPALLQSSLQIRFDLKAIFFVTPPDRTIATVPGGVLPVSPSPKGSPFDFSNRTSIHEDMWSLPTSAEALLGGPRFVSSVNPLWVGPAEHFCFVFRLLHPSPVDPSY